MDVTLSQTDSLPIFKKAKKYLDEKFPSFSCRYEIESGGDASVYIYSNKDKQIRLVIHCFVDAVWIESNFDFEVPRFEE